MKKLLVIEDRDNHWDDAKNFFSQPLPIEFEMLHATTLETALELLPKADWVMSDIFFPTKTGNAEKTNCKQVVVECLKSGKPIVLITSTHHHGTKTEPVNKWARKLHVEIFDKESLLPGSRDLENEAEHKPWKDAFVGLMYLVTGLKLGLIEVHSHGYEAEGGQLSFLGSDIWRYFDSKARRDIIDDPEGYHEKNKKAQKMIFTELDKNGFG